MIIYVVCHYCILVLSSVVKMNDMIMVYDSTVYKYYLVWLIWMIMVYDITAYGMHNCYQVWLSIVF